MIYQKILYTTGIEITKELYIARWMEADMNRLTRKFTEEAMREWDDGGEGDFKTFIKEHVLLKWFEYTRTN